MKLNGLYRKVIKISTYNGLRFFQGGLHSGLWELRPKKASGETAAPNFLATWYKCREFREITCKGRAKKICNGMSKMAWISSGAGLDN